MTSRQFRLSIELTGAIGKRLPHAKSQLSAPGSFFNQFVKIYILTIKTRLMFVFIYIQARFACLRCAAGGHFMSAGGTLRSPGITMVNYKGDSKSKYAQLTVNIDITRKITKIINF